MLRYDRLSLAALLGLLCCVEQPAKGEPAAATMIVLDASGSMDGEIGADRRKKQDIAREGLGATLTALPPTARIGLVGFGHRKRGCSDVETLVPPEAGSARTLAALPAVRPNRGKGPLVAAVREAHRVLSADGGAGSIVLVHDGADNCGQDACLAAQELAKANPKISISLVALGIDKAELAKVSCLATTTRGRVFEIADGAAAAAAFSEALRVAMPASEPSAPEAPAQAAADPTDAEGPARLRLAASLAEGGPALGAPTHWRVFKGGEATGTPVLDRVAPTFTEPLPPGTYTIEAHHGLVLTRGPVEVAETGVTAVTVPLAAGVIRISAKSARTGEPLQDASLALVRKAEEGQPAAEEAVWVGTGDADLVVPAGPYAVRLDLGLVRTEQTIKLTPGGRAVSEFSPAFGQLELSAVAIEGGPPLSNVTYLVAEDDPDSPQGRREIARSAHPEPRFSISAGTYYVTVRAGDTEVRQRIAVGPGDVVKRPIVLGLARVQVQAALDGGQLDGLGVLHRVLSLDEEPREIARSSATPATFHLAAGKYRIETTAGTENVKTTTEVDLAPGQQHQLAQRLAAARVTLDFGQPTSQTSGAWEVRDAKGDLVWWSLRTGAHSTYLAPGRYTARIESNERWLEKEFEAKPGEELHVVLSGAGPPPAATP
jgi:Ca-activated chloride channel family protein